MKRLWAAIFVLTLLADSAAGQWTAALWSSGSQTPQNPAVVRIMAPGAGSISYGSGSLVAKSQKHGLVVTNWHVVSEATGQITVMFPDGFNSAGTVVKLDRDWDLAAIAVWRPNAEPLTLAGVAPQPGETLTIAGYGSGNYRAASGRCTQYVAPGLTFPYEMVELATSARQGDSGGPILNSRGELAGVLFGEGGGRTAGSYCGRVQWFLADLAPADANNNNQAMLAAAANSGSQVAVQENRFAAPAQPGARVGSLAALGLPPVRLTTTPAGQAPARPAAPATAFASTAGPSATGMAGAGLPRNDGWQSAAPRGMANPDRTPPAPRARPRSPDSELAAVPTLRGIPDTAVFGHSNPGGFDASSSPDSFDSASHDRNTLPISWTDIAGHTLGEQVKTVLATIGGLAVFMQTISWLSRDTKSAKPSDDEEDEDDDDDDDDDDD